MCTVWDSNYILYFKQFCVKLNIIFSYLISNNLIKKLIVSNNNN